MAAEEEQQQQHQGTPHYSEVAHLKGRCAELEAENQELRKICGGGRTGPRYYLPVSPGSRPRDLANNLRVAADDSSPEEAPPAATSTSTTTLESPGRARGFKKIFGRIKRSNSGGHLMEGKASAAVDQQQQQQFRRGGFRATAGGRLPHPQQPQQPHHHHVSPRHNAAALAGHLDKREEMNTRWAV